MTPKQEIFAVTVAGGSNQTAAFCEAYNVEGMKQSTIWSEASRLRRHPKVAARIDQLKAEAELSAAGSNPAPATTFIELMKQGSSVRFLI